MDLCHFKNSELEPQFLKYEGRVVLRGDLQLHQHRETCGTVGQHKTKYARVVVEADGSMRIRVDGSQSKNHEDHIAGKGMNSLSCYNLVHKFIPVPEAMKIPDAKAAVEKEWENRRDYWHNS